MGGGFATIAAEEFTNGHGHSIDRMTLSTALPPHADSSRFDVCQGALVWRTLLMVNGALALGAVAVSATPADALSRAGPLLMVGIVGTVVWLMGICAARETLARGHSTLQRGALVAWGVLVAVAAYAVLAWMTMELTSAWRWTAAALVGAGLASALSIWIEQRRRVVRPAHADARLAELQARIRPHFLFNTLNTATALVRVDPPAAEGMLEDLADLFRAALNEARTATLGEEVAVARQYMAIEQRRFGNRLQVQWELDAQTEQAPVPSLMLQPLLENAVHHGVESMPEGAWIRVRTRSTKGQAHIEIENNVGAATPTGSGMALANVRERLRLLHDVDGRFDARRDGDRFVVRIGIPLRAVP